MQVLELLAVGAVQGVGFRPLVFRIAHRLGLGGAVWNEPGGVRIRLVGPARRVEEFGARLRAECRAPARLDQLRVLSVSETDAAEPFRIADSVSAGSPDALVMPDLATCPDCLREMYDPRNRRYRHPFINCTHCGPRFSIVTGIPYDRARTTMQGFAICEACRAEYENPADRRFHAQPIACPRCGPEMELWDVNGKRLGARDWAVRAAVQHIRAGQIVAVKGIGGFHLMCDARNADVVRELRRRKRRDEKPFAVMAPDIGWARLLAEVGDAEAELLRSAAAPIVLVKRRAEPIVAEPVAPANPYLGLMLPYAPVHHLLLRELECPVVATSGNLSDEPICTDEREAVKRLDGIADFFLVHNRPIARPQDDSIAHIVDGRVCLLRRARGYAPLAMPLPFETPPLLALGAHLKNTIALAWRDRIVLSQHHGDLDSLESRRAFEQAVADLPALFGVAPERWAADRHPDYASSLYAQDRQLAPIAVQHHHAHIAAVMAEHGLEGPVLGVAWDGTGLGDDGTIWGGEFLRVQGDRYLRLGRLGGFRLPGGDGAMRKPLHAAFGALTACVPERMPELAERLLGMDAESRRACAAMIASESAAPFTSSAGRWFDAISAICGLCRESTYEGQAAQRLEYACAPATGLTHFTVETRVEGGLMVWDFAPLVRELLDEIARNTPVGVLATRFHLTLADVVAQMAEAHRGLPVALGGGCFQNRFLLQACIRRLREGGHAVYWAEQIPPNDGGISLGQAAIACMLIEDGTRKPEDERRKTENVFGHSRAD
jgi:hydrogenase maturation protein HypF